MSIKMTEKLMKLLTKQLLPVKYSTSLHHTELLLIHEYFCALWTSILFTLVPTFSPSLIFPDVSTWLVSHLTNYPDLPHLLSVFPW